MTFTDDDLKRLRDYLDGECVIEPDRHFFDCLLARLEAAEVLVQQLQDGHFPQPWAIEAWRKAKGE